MRALTPFRWCLLLMAIGLAIRLALIAGLRSYQIPVEKEHFQFAAEYGRIARWLALGHGYASPYSLVNDAPTVIGAPFFPACIALLFSIFGIYSSRAAAALLVFNSVIAVALIPLVYVLGRRLFGPPVGRIAAALACFDPILLWYSAAMTWETMLSCLALTLVLALLLWVEEHPIPARGGWAGLGLGAAAHVNMGALLMGATFAAGLVLAAKDLRPALVRALGAAAAVVILVCLPWSIRNTAVAGRPLLLRGGEEIALHDGNHPGATGDGFLDAMRADPANHPPERKLYWQMGEREYLRHCREGATMFIRTHPDEYRRLILRRAVAFWLGNFSPPPAGESAEHRSAARAYWSRFVTHLMPMVLAVIGIVVARRRGWRTWPLVVPVLVYSLPYMLVFCGGPRHRAPIEGVLILLSSVTIWSAYESLRVRFTAGGRTELAGPRRDQRPRDAEVRYQRVALRDQDVAGIDVAVHHPAPVGVVEGVRHLSRDAQRILERQLLLAGEPVAQRLALDERHDE
jgi:dolichyl-phosphate-mannose-protein mannosyltransferase